MSGCLESASKSIGLRKPLLESSHRIAIGFELFKHDLPHRFTRDKALILDHFYLERMENWNHSFKVEAVHGEQFLTR